jgi:hypothetical protein
MLECASEQPRCSLLAIDISNNSIPHRPIAAPALLPHPLQGRVTGVDDVDYPHVVLGRMFAMQAPCVLGEGSLPRNRHGQHQRIQRRVIEAFADELPGSQQDPRCIRLRTFCENSIFTAQRIKLAG